MREKIRIMHIAQAAGGVDIYLRMLLKYLNDEKFENIVVCSQDFNSFDYLELVEHFEQLDMQRSIGIKDFKVAIQVRNLIQKYQPDIVYAHSSKAGAIARIANIGIKNKSVYNPHGWAFNMRDSGKKQIIYAVLEKIMAPFCDKIICISDAEKMAALSRGICSEKKLQVIFSGIDVEAYDTQEYNKVAREELGIPQNAFVVGMVGRLCPQKAPDTFMRMARRVRDIIPNTHFVFVGEGELQNKLLQYAKEHKMCNLIHITGWVDNPISYMELFDVAVLLSRWEGFGLVIPEYMIAKKPIVATAVDAIPNLIKDHVNGILVPIDDPRSACNAVVELYSDVNLKNRLIVQGVKDVYEKYDVKRVSKEHEELFEILLKEDAKLEYELY